MVRLVSNLPSNIAYKVLNGTTSTYASAVIKAYVTLPPHHSTDGHKHLTEDKPGFFSCVVPRW